MPCMMLQKFSLALRLAWLELFQPRQPTKFRLD
jgi:hypothetical protein